MVIRATFIAVEKHLAPIGAQLPFARLSPITRTTLCILVMVLVAALPVMASDADGHRSEPGTVELRVRPQVSFTGALFDETAARIDRPDALDGSWWAYSTGLELSYQMATSFGARLRWYPGFRFPSGYSQDQRKQRNGPSNLRIGFPMYLLSASASHETGSRENGGAMLGTSPIRLTATPKAVIKIRGYDRENQATLRSQGEDYIAEHPDRKAHALGLGLREAFWLSNRARLDASQELLFYFPADYEEQSLANYDTNLVRDGIDGADPYDTIYYRYRLSGAVGGSYLLQDFPRSRWTAGLSVGGHYMPAPIVDDILVENTDSFLVSVEPSIAVEPRVWKGRSGFELSWSIPLFGKNEDATHEIALALRTTLYSPSGDDPKADDSDTGE